MPSISSPSFVTSRKGTNAPGTAPPDELLRSDGDHVEVAGIEVVPSGDDLLGDLVRRVPVGLPRRPLVQRQEPSLGDPLRPLLARARRRERDERDDRDEQHASHDRTASSIATMSSAFVSGTNRQQTIIAAGSIAIVISAIASPIEPTRPVTWSPRIPTTSAPSTPPTISKALRHHAAARERT